MFRIGITLIFALLLAAVVGSCTITPDTYVLATAGSTKVTLKDIEDHPNFKMMVEEMVVRKIAAGKAREAGIHVDEAEVKKRMDEIKEQIGPGEAWENYLQMNGMTEEMATEQIRAHLEMLDYLKSKVEVKEEEVKAAFDQNPDFYREQYATENNLTADEADYLTYEDLKDYLIEQYTLNQAYRDFQSFVEKIKEEADIKYLWMSPELRKLLETKPAEVKEPAGGPVDIQENGSGEDQNQPAAEGEGQTAAEGSAEGEKGAEAGSADNGAKDEGGAKADGGAEAKGGDSGEKKETGK
jgi:hypothetical protein